MNQRKSKPRKPSQNGCYFWEVRGSSAKLYLIGTVHLVPKSFFPLRDEIMKAFEECRNLVVEVAPSEDSDEGINITDDIVYNSNYTYEEGDSLYNHFPREKVIRLRNYLLKNGFCSKEIAKRFYKLKPPAVKALLLDGIIKKGGIEKQHIGIDYYLMEKAREMNKNILGLETAEFQIELLNKLHSRTIYEEGSDYRADGVSSETLGILDKGWFFKFRYLIIPSLALGARARISRDLYKSEKFIIKSRKYLLSKENPLVGKRDEEMFNKIEGFLRVEDSYFVAVGAMHLLGEGSIIDRLKGSGYDVRRRL